MPTADSQPNFITAGPDGALWFTEAIGNQIGRITTAGVVIEYPVATADSEPWGITTGADGALWFTEWDGDKIGRITTAGVITEYRLPTFPSTPYGITAGADGALWFTENNTNKIGRITTAGVITEYPIGVGSPWGITALPEGDLWFVADNNIGRAPACGLGFSASFANTTLTMNFNLGTAAPATFDIVLRDSTGPFGEPVSKAIPAVVPPKAFTIDWSNFPNKGDVTVVPQLIAGSGQGLCAEWTTVNTAQ